MPFAGHAHPGVGRCAGSGYHLGDWKDWLYAAWTQDKEATVCFRVGSLQSWTRRTTSRLSTTAAHGSPWCRGRSSRLWVRQRLILSPLVSTLLDADDPVTKAKWHPVSASLVLDFQTPQIAKTIGRANGTSCQLPCRWPKFVDGKSRDNTPSPTIFSETHNRWKG